MRIGFANAHFFCAFFYVAPALPVLAGARDRRALAATRPSSASRA
jgi:hypothetical protein